MAACRPKRECSMRNNSKGILLPEEIYTCDLTIINGIRFTPKQIDVIACWLQGRKPAEIASVLGTKRKPYNVNTVEVHLQNISEQLGNRGRGFIRDFIENSNKRLILHNHYLTLLTAKEFVTSLQDISTLLGYISLPLFLVIWQQEKTSFSNRLRYHLKLIGANILENLPVSILVKDLGKCMIYVVPKIEVASLEQEEHLKNHISIAQCSIRFEINDEKAPIIFLLQEEYSAITLSKVFNYKYIDITKQTKEYYFLFFEIVKSSFSEFNAELEKIIIKFSEKCQNIYAAPCNILYDTSVGRNDFLTAAGLIRSDLTNPIESLVLERPHLLHEIDKKFEQKEGIQIVALVGVGGTGKTILARQYSCQQKARVIYEINAETRGSLKESFEHLAYALAKTDDDRQILIGVQSAQEPLVREEKIICFVKNQLLSNPNWFLIMIM